VSEGAAGLFGFGAVLVLIGFGVPVALAMAAVGVLGFALLNGVVGAEFILASAPFEAVVPYGLSVVPLFVLMGALATRAGLSQALYAAAYAFVGRFRGGLAMATVGACALFGAICGSSLATAATMAQVALPEMRRRGYADPLSAASIAAGGTLGVMIPPSIILVLYGLLTQTSIGALFVAALLPGLLGMACYMGAIAVQCRLRPAAGAAGEPYGLDQTLQVVRRVWGVALLFLLVVGGLYVGWFSPTEAAAVGAFGAFVLAVLARRLGRQAAIDAALETARTSGMIFFILIGAALFSYFIEGTRLPDLLVTILGDAGIGAYATLVVILLFYLLLGCLMDSLSMVLLTVPVLFPVAMSLDFGLPPAMAAVWFGILVTTVAEIGMITPPVGMNLFVIQGVTGLKQDVLVRGIMPFVVADVVRLVLLVGFPWLTLWLPSHMGP
jgi:tripartite ATP-independent transporter DctM subunit